MNYTDTIAAIATADGVGGIGIVRISGSEARQVLQKVFNCKVQEMEARKLYLGSLQAKGFSDKCLAVYFPSPNSYTGEDMAELHCHGGRQLIYGVLSAVLASGARMAENGEFTRRAFLNGKMDLSESEAVIEMINSQSIAELNAQYNQLIGGLGKEINEIQNRLTDIICGIEVVLDYPEEDINLVDFSKELASLSIDLKRLKDSYRVGGLLKSGVRVSVVGRPNVGKSSLMNCLLGYTRAIVADEAGTTRDVVKEEIEISGVRFILSDTAGIRSGGNKIECIGIELSKNSILESDITLFVVDGKEDLTEEDRQIIKLLRDRTVILVCNKNDDKDYKNRMVKGISPTQILELSAKNKSGIEELKKAMFRTVVGDNLSQGGTLLTNERHFDCVARACKVIDNLLDSCHKKVADMFALELKTVWDILGEITGTTASEEIVDRIFSKFCLGK